CLSDGPRLHAKVYLFGDEVAVVTSANLTTSALGSNIEVGVQLTGSAVQELVVWFDTFWAKAGKFGLPEVSIWQQWQQETEALRQESDDLGPRARAMPPLPREALAPVRSPAKKPARKKQGGKPGGKDAPPPLGGNGPATPRKGKQGGKSVLHPYVI